MTNPPIIYRLHFVLEELASAIECPVKVISEMLKDGRFVSQLANLQLAGRDHMELISDRKSGWLIFDKKNRTFWKVRVAGRYNLELSPSSNRGEGREYDQTRTEEAMRKIDGYYVVFLIDVNDLESVPVYQISNTLVREWQTQGILNPQFGQDSVLLYRRIQQEAHPQLF